MSKKTKPSKKSVDSKKKKSTKKFKIKTRQVAEHFGMTPERLRGILRQHFYGDGKYTSYGWKSMDDPEIKQLGKIIAQMKAPKKKQKIKKGKELRDFQKRLKRKKVKKSNKSKLKLGRLTA